MVFHPKCGDWEAVNDWHIPIPDKKPTPEEPFIVRPIFHTALIEKEAFSEISTKYEKQIL